MRVKILKCSKSLFVHRRARTRSFGAFQKFASVHVRARVVRAHSAYGKSKFNNFTWYGFLTLYLTISMHLKSFLTFYTAVRSRQSSMSVRVAMGNIMQICSKKQTFWKRNSSYTIPYNRFLWHGWKEDELEIWFLTTRTPQNGKKVIKLATKLKKCVFHRWRHVFLSLTQFISLIPERFSPKFGYVVAQPILYKTYV